MKRLVLVVIVSLIALSNLYASDSCDSQYFQTIKANFANMENAWDSGDINQYSSFYDANFIYMNGGQPFKSKQSVVKHYIENFSVNKNDKADFGKLKFDYEYCRQFDNETQLAIMKYIWTDAKGMKSSGHELFIWQKDDDGKYKITVDFIQS